MRSAYGQKDRSWLERKFLSVVNPTVIVGCHVRAAGVDRYMPRARRRQRGENERDWFVRAVNEKDEIVILDRLAFLVVLARRAAFEIKPETSCIRLTPLLVGHLAPIRRKPYNVFDAGSRD